MLVQPRPPVTSTREWAFPRPREYELPNGICVWQYHLPGQRLVTANLVFDLPLSVESTDQEGITCLVSRTLDEGTELRSAEDFAEQTERFGACYSARVTYSGFRTSIDVPADRIQPALGLLAEAASRPAFPDEEVRRAVRNRLDDIVDERSQPARRGWLELTAAIFAPDCRLSRPDSGVAETIGGLDREDLVRFYREHVGADRATLVLAGDLSGVDVHTAITDAFAGWSTDVMTPLPAIEPVPVRRRRVRIVHRPGAVQTYLQFGTTAVDRRDPDWAPLRLAGYVLGGSITSRLDTVLREEKGYTYGIRSELRPYRIGSVFAIGGSVHTAVTGESVELVSELLAELLSGGVTETERNTAVDYLLGVTPLRYQTADAVADRAADLAHARLGPDYPDAERAELAAVAAEDAAPALARCVGDAGADRLSLIAVGDADVIAEPLQRIYDEVDILEA